jgi:hypothetical protein
MNPRHKVMGMQTVGAIMQVTECAGGHRVRDVLPEVQLPTKLRLTDRVAISQRQVHRSDLGECIEQARVRGLLAGAPRKQKYRRRTENTIYGHDKPRVKTPEPPE